MTMRRKVMIALCLTSALNVQAAPSEHSFLYAMKACAPNEKWFTEPPTEGGGISDQWIHKFSSYLQGKSSSVVGFSQGLALRRLASNTQDRAFSEYWISRALLGAGMVHLAESGFKSILSQETTADLAPFQLAALACLNVIRTKHGIYTASATMSGELRERLTELSAMIPSMTVSPRSLKPVIWEAAVNLITTSIASTDTYQVKGHRELMALLQGSGPYETLANGIVHSSRSLGPASSKAEGKATTQSQVIGELQKFLATAGGSEYLKSYRSHVYLMLGRAYYAIGQYDKAAEAYRKIGVRSNEWVHALSELAWSYLMSGKYQESIGVGVGVQTGALRKTFSPESLMVTAMALNEMCYFPESLKMVQKFKLDYLPSYRWLKADLAQVAGPSYTPASNYKLAIAFTRNTPGLAIPPPVASEWIRSPVFLTNQENINLLIREKSTSDQLTLQGTTEQKDMAQKLITQLRTLKTQYAKAKIKLPSGGALPDRILLEIAKAQEAIALHAQVRNAAPFWRVMLANFQSRSEIESKDAVEKIGQYITQLNRRMFTQLEEIAANHELLEVEIFNGASEDIVWQNAHPDFKNVVAKMKNPKENPNAGAVWDWGNSLGGLSGQGEIWEDEVGSLSANLHDNCENKTRYLEVKHQLQAGL